MMTETTIRVLLSELETIRIICRIHNCGGVSELSLDKLRKTDRDRIDCPQCGATLIELTRPDRSKPDQPLVALAELIVKLKSLTAAYSVEFPIHVPDQKKTPT